MWPMLRQYCAAPANHPNKTTLIDILRQYSQQYAGGYKPTGKNVVGAKPSLLAAVSAQPTTSSYTGSYPDNLAAVLNGKFYNGQGDRKWRAAAYNTTKELKQWMRARSPTDPCICQVTWDNGGSHFIVCCGAEATKQSSGANSGHRHYYFSDPYYGLQWIRIPHEDNNARLTYWPYDNTSGKWGGRGRFSTWIVYRM